MCESCSSGGLDRREFLMAAGTVGAMGVASQAIARTAGSIAGLPTIEKKPARVLVGFLYPPADAVNEGRMEDHWRVHNWFTWPGNQFKPEEQDRKFTGQIKRMADALGIEAEFFNPPVWQGAKVQEFIAKAKADQPDAVLIVNFWNSFSKWSFQMATESQAPTAIVYHPVGSNHQLPPDYLRNAEGLYYIHAIEDFDAIERGLRAVKARKMLAQSRMLRVSGRVKELKQTKDEMLGVDVVEVPADEFNNLFDAVKPDEAIVKRAAEFRKNAIRVTDVTDEYCIEALRAHRAVERIMKHFGADAITIECLMLKHRKPCISFALNNGNLVPCGCENDLNATLTLMLGRHLLDRGGFQHNPEFDLSDNRYFGSHCTCAWHLHGPEAAANEYFVRPFFHQLPKTAALDVQWTPGEPVMLAKCNCNDKSVTCWTGKVVESPASPPTGGCATRVLVDMDNVDDICNVYPGPHPVLFCGDRGEAKRFKAFARMYRLQMQGNV